MAPSSKDQSLQETRGGSTDRRSVVGATKLALRVLARRVRALDAEIAELDAELRGEAMQAAYPEEFRRRAISLVREKGRTVTQVARELGIASRGCAGGWIAMTSTAVLVS